MVATGVQLSKESRMGAAKLAFSDAVERAPTSAPAIYNLAVFVEADGDYDRAEELLQRALQIRQKPLYLEALSRVRAARQTWQTTARP